MCAINCIIPDKDPNTFFYVRLSRRESPVFAYTLLRLSVHLDRGTCINGCKST